MRRYRVIVCGAGALGKNIAEGLARSLVVLASAVACETIIRYVDDGEKVSRTMTLGDLTIAELPATSTEK